MLTDALIVDNGALGKADVVMTYTSNKEVRPLIRRAISWFYVFICNTLFGLHLKYFTGLTLIKTDLVRSLLPISEGFGYSTEIIVRLLKRGHTYLEVPMQMTPPVPGRRSAAFRFKNILSVLKTLLRLTVQVWFKA